MEIIALKLEEVDPTLCDRLSTFLSPDRRSMLRKFKFVEDRIRSIFSELLVRTYTIENFGMVNEEIRFIKNKYGKPAIAGSMPFHYNISHSGHWVVAVFDDFPVGIDIEKIEKIDLAVADFCFSQVEKKQLLDQPEESHLAHFYKVWTLKESYIKAVGKGLSIPPQSFSISLINKEIRFQSDTDKEHWCFHQYTIDDGYKLSLCATHSNFSKKIHTMSSNDLAKRFQLITSK